MKSAIIPIDLSFGSSYVTVEFKNVKRLSLRVRRDRITVSAPLFTSMKSIESFVNKNLSWIEKHYVTAIDKEVFMLGEKYVVNVADGRPKVEVKEGSITVYSPQGDEAAAKKTMLRWWRKQFKEYVTSESTRIYDEVKRDFSLAGYPTIAVSSAHSYWGKCFYQKNAIKFSYYLFQADPDTIRYVIYHEFCHFKNHGHDRAFYDDLKSFYQDVKGAKNKLKQYHSELWFDE